MKSSSTKIKQRMFLFLCIKLSATIYFIFAPLVALSYIMKYYSFFFSVFFVIIIIHFKSLLLHKLFHNITIKINYSFLYQKKTLSVYEFIFLYFYFELLFFKYIFFLRWFIMKIEVEQLNLFVSNLNDLFNIHFLILPSY